MRSAVAPALLIYRTWCGVAAPINTHVGTVSVSITDNPYAVAPPPPPPPAAKHFVAHQSPCGPQKNEGVEKINFFPGPPTPLFCLLLVRRNTGYPSNRPPSSLGRPDTGRAARLNRGETVGRERVAVPDPTRGRFRLLLGHQAHGSSVSLGTLNCGAQWGRCCRRFSTFGQSPRRNTS